MLLLLLVSLVACKGESNVDIVTTTEAKSTAENSIEEIETTTIEESIIEDDEIEEVDEFSALAELGEIEVNQGLFNVELTIPADYVEGMTQDELDDTVDEEGYKSITLNEDGSATYVMTKEQHKKMMDEIKSSFNESMREMVGSETYPSFVSIEANNDFY